MPRQALPDVYWQTGHIDVIPRQTLTERGSMTGAAVAGLVVGPRYAIDIDTEEQWRQAEWLLEHGGLDIVSPAELGATLGSRTFDRRQRSV
ncbi:MAG: hypothetical protein ACREM1_01010 [Longimicrobiales bacterium]